MPLSKIDFAKRAVSIVVGVGISKIVKGIIENNTTQDRLSDKAPIMVATFVLGTMAADATRNYTDAKVELIADWISRTFNLEID